MAMGEGGRACGGDGVGARAGGAREGSPWVRWGPLPIHPNGKRGGGKFFFRDPRSGESWARPPAPRGPRKKGAGLKGGGLICINLHTFA